MDDHSGWDAVAERMHQEVLRRGGIRALERASGVHYTTLRKLLNGQRVARQDRLAVLAMHLGWLPDGFDRLRRGEDPAGEAPSRTESGAGETELEAQFVLKCTVIDGELHLDVQPPKVPIGPGVTVCMFCRGSGTGQTAR